MRKRTRVWTLPLAVTALAALPVIASAQTYPPSGQSMPPPGQSTGQGNPSSQYGSSDQNSPQFHLDEAKQVIDSISASDLTGDAATRIARLKTEFTTLYTDYSNKSASATSGSSTSGSSSAGQVGTSGTATTGSDWKSDFTSIERDLDGLGIPKSSYAPASSESGSAMSGGTSGTSGTSSAGTSGTAGGSASGTAGGSMSGTMSGSASTASVNLPSDVHDKLAQFRTHLEQFYSLTGRQ